MINTSKLKLAVVLMAIAGIVIIGMAVYVVIHFSNWELSQGIALAIVGVIALLIVMGAVIVLLKSVTSNNKTTTIKK